MILVSKENAILALHTEGQHVMQGNESSSWVWNLEIRLCRIPWKSSNSSALIHKHQTEVKSSTHTDQTEVKTSSTKHVKKRKALIKRTGCIPNVSNKEVADEIKINQKTIRQSMKEFLELQPYKIKQCPKFDSQHNVGLQKWIAPMKWVEDD